MRKGRGTSIWWVSCLTWQAYRIIRPGGVIRVTTPDLEKYMEGYVHRSTNSFLQDSFLKGYVHRSTHSLSQEYVHPSTQ